MTISVTQINKLYHPWLGGIETHVKDVSEALQSTVALQVICCNTTRHTTQDTVHGVRVTRYGSIGMWLSLPLSLSFVRYFRQHAASILHFHLPNPLAVMAYIIRRPTGRILITWHSDIIKQSVVLFFYAPFLRWFLRRADRIIVTSPNMARHSRFLRPHHKKIEVVPLGISADMYSPQPRPALAPPRYALFVGRLTYYKGVIPLIQALQDSSVTLVMIGEGPLASDVAHMGRDMIGSGQLQCLPCQDSNTLKGFFNHCDFLVLPSTHESEAFGIVQLEAMIYGAPVISTRLPTGVPYVNQHNETGITVEPGNPRDLTLAMQDLWDNHDRRITLGAQARQRCITHFSQDHMVSSIRRIIQDIHVPQNV